jgi:ATPase subunit of ABC transporter with duplicated ATPase domains
VQTARENNALEILTQKIKPESGFIELGETIKIGYYGRKAFTLMSR